MFPSLFPQGSGPLKVVGFFLKCWWFFFVLEASHADCQTLQEKTNSFEVWGIAAETRPGRETRSSPFGCGARGRQW